MHITFKPSNLVEEAKREEKVLDIANRANVFIYSSCGGNGFCGKCKVRVISGEVNELTESEKEYLSEMEQKAGYRLACKVKVRGNLVVEVLSSNDVSERKEDMMQLPSDFLKNPMIQKKRVRIKRVLPWNKQKGFPSIESSFIEDITITCFGQKIIDVEAGNTLDSCYGVCFDIGTTTVVGMLWNIRKNKLLEVIAKTNPQAAFGADVITRIQFCNEVEENLFFMQKKILDCVSDMLKEFIKRRQIRQDNIYDMTVVGNTTMTHLFLGVSPKSLARVPFEPVFCDARSKRARDFHLPMNPYGNILVLPNIAGHVGADLTAVLLATDLKQKIGTHIVIDIGTNGEVLVGKDGRILACSTAAGPAFEGASIYQGMRAAKGAIERVICTESRIETLVIGGEEPVGLCGSGLIDAVAQFLDANLMDDTGRILTRKEALEQGISLNLASRLIHTENGNSIVLAYRKTGENIILTQKDIREVQLAKAAIYAGIKTLMKRLGVKTEDIHAIYLAGAFGNYIQKESAVRIGLLPQLSMEKIISIGNAAGVGACMALLSKDMREKADFLAKTTEHIELATDLEFQEEYINGMSF